MGLLLTMWLGRTAIKSKHGIDRLTAIFKDQAEFAPPPVAGAEKFAQRHGLTGKIGRDRAAEEAVFIEDLNLPCRVDRSGS